MSVYTMAAAGKKELRGLVAIVVQTHIVLRIYIFRNAKQVLSNR